MCLTTLTNNIITIQLTKVGQLVATDSVSHTAPEPDTHTILAAIYVEDDARSGVDAPVKGSAV